MLNQNLVDIADFIASSLLSAAPIDTGALKLSITYKIFDDNNIEIYVGNDKVDYAVYTNIKWDPPVNLEYFPSGKKRTENDKTKLKSYAYGGNNPNEGWFDITLEQCMKNLTEIYKGVYLIEL